MSLQLNAPILSLLNAREETRCAAVQFAAGSDGDALHPAAETIRTVRMTLSPWVESEETLNVWRGLSVPGSRIFESLISSKVLEREVLDRFKMPVFSE
jgi:hypothetical protein